jgi:hypothetical protein
MQARRATTCSAFAVSFIFGYTWTGENRSRSMVDWSGLVGVNGMSKLLREEVNASRCMLVVIGATINGDKKQLTFITGELCN